MASLLTEEQVTAFREFFNEEVDVDGKGTITIEELSNKLEEDGEMGPEIFVMIAMADKNSDGMINFEEFLEMMVKG